MNASETSQNPEHDPAHSKLSTDIEQLITDAEVPKNLVKQVRTLLETSIGLADDNNTKLDLKIASAALAEMRTAYKLFQPFTEVPKVTVFGSARTQSDDPTYIAAREVTERLAQDGWMSVTGAGPGIMQAATEGAGPGKSIGVSIRLPFEEPSMLDGDAKVSELRVHMKYFFTRKLMLIKESAAFICLPGGFGTLDETFELLTLQQTGKSEPTPIVLLDAPGGTYWTGMQTFAENELVKLGMINDDDLDRVLITDSIEEAAQEISEFWSNYHSIRWFGDQIVFRIRHMPSEAELQSLNEQFSDLLESGSFTLTTARKAEVRDDDVPEMPRVAAVLKRRAVGSLHKIIRAMNRFESARS